MTLTERGMRFVMGREAEVQTQIVRRCSYIAASRCYEPVLLPTIEPESIYADKLGDETGKQTFRVEGKRPCVLRPEGTATIQAWARENWKSIPCDTMLYYVARCFRRERPQEGRYREFTQFGVEVIKPKRVSMGDVLSLAESMIGHFVSGYTCKQSVKRGLSYYTDGEGFEIECPSLGAQKQAVGGGAYEEGMGFAIGVDRLALAVMKEQGE